MALTETTVLREVDATGDGIKTYKDAGDAHVQAMGLSDENGDHAAIESWYGTSSSAENDAIVKASAGRLFEIRVINPSTSKLYLHVFNRTTSPTGGLTPVWRGLVPADGELSESFGPLGFPVDTGAVVAVSTTVNTYTAPSGGQAYFHVGYK